MTIARSIRFLVLIVLAAAFGGGAFAAMPGAPAADWQHLAVPGTDLAVDMPGTPTKGDDIVAGGMHTIAYHVTEGDTRAFGVRAEQVAAGLVASEGANGILDDVRNTLVADGTLRVDQVLPTQGDVVGRSLVIDSEEKTGPGAYTTVVHLYLRDGWIYVLVATVPRGDESDPTARRFLESARFSGR